ncbi:flagellar protein FlaG [Halobacillus salinus]|uniref:flagellar protein FlaG n=1 Tax=Halobacillus salinus TaxID=192814 RepID=UPI001F4F2F71|nr:flagellar protein FlaG [Halobacillus salinus]
MDVQNKFIQTQLLQRTTQQLSTHTPVQSEAKNQSDDTNPLTQAEEKEKVKEVTDSMNEFLKPVHTTLKFQFHDKLEEYYVSIIDEETDEVIREIPPRKMLDLYASIAESLGIIVDHKI